MRGKLDFRVLSSELEAKVNESGEVMMDAWTDIKEWDAEGRPMEQGYYLPVKEYDCTVCDADGGNVQPFEANPETMDPEQVDAIERLEVGESVSFGGGSQPIFTFTRIN